MGQNRNQTSVISCKPIFGKQFGWSNLYCLKDLFCTINQIGRYLWQSPHLQDTICMAGNLVEFSIASFSCLLQLQFRCFVLSANFRSSTCFTLSFPEWVLFFTGTEWNTSRWEGKRVNKGNTAQNINVALLFDWSFGVCCWDYSTNSTWKKSFERPFVFLQKS